MQGVVQVVADERLRSTPVDCAMISHLIAVLASNQTKIFTVVDLHVQLYNNNNCTCELPVVRNFHFLLQ